MTPAFPSRASTRLAWRGSATASWAKVPKFRLRSEWKAAGGKQDNCQGAVSLSAANDYASLPIAYQLFLPEAWANDPVRRDRAGVPEAINFETKTALAPDQLRRARADGVPVRIVLGDPVTVTRPPSGSASRTSACATSLGCARAPASGRPALRRCRLPHGLVVGGQLPGCGVMRTISQWRSRRWRLQ